MPRKLLYLDMDGVVADFNAGIRLLDPNVDAKHYNNTKDRVDAICEANPTIFHNLPEIAGAIPAVNRLFDIFDVYFLSTPMWNVPLSFTGKRIWLEEKFGDLAVKRLILTHRKDLNIGHYIVDDRKANGVEDFQGEHIHFGSHPFFTWHETLPYLEFLATL